MDEKDQRRRERTTWFVELLGGEEGEQDRGNRLLLRRRIQVEVWIGDGEGEWDRWRLKKKKEERRDEEELDRMSRRRIRLLIPAAVDPLASGGEEGEWVRWPC